MNIDIVNFGEEVRISDLFFLSERHWSVLITQDLENELYTHTEFVSSVYRMSLFSTHSLIGQFWEAVWKVLKVFTSPPG